MANKGNNKRNHPSKINYHNNIISKEIDEQGEASSSLIFDIPKPRGSEFPL